LRVERKEASIKFEGFKMTTWPSNWVVLRAKKFFMEDFDNHSLEGDLGQLLKNATIRRLLIPFLSLNPFYKNSSTP
jgi:hypothetical protein